MGPTGARRCRYGRVRRTAERPRRLTRRGARRIRAGWIRPRCVRPGRVCVGWICVRWIHVGRIRTVRVTARSVRLRFGVAPRVVRTRVIAMRFGRRRPATGRDWASRTPGRATATWCPRRHRSPRVHGRWAGAGRHRRVHGGRAVRSGPGAIRCAGTLLRDRGAAGPRWERRLRAPPRVGSAGRPSLVAVLIGLARRHPLPGHRWHAGPGRGGGARAFVTLVVAHAASPRP